MQRDGKERSSLQIFFSWPSSNCPSRLGWAVSFLTPHSYVYPSQYAPINCYSVYVRSISQLTDYDYSGQVNPWLIDWFAWLMHIPIYKYPRLVDNMGLWYYFVIINIFFIVFKICCYLILVYIWCCVATNCPDLYQVNVGHILLRGLN